MKENGILKEKYVLTQRNKNFCPQSNSRFDYIEEVCFEQDHLLLFEKLSLKNTNNEIFARLKFFELIDDQFVLQKIIPSNQFDSDIKKIICVSSSNKTNYPKFMTVHKNYSKVWQCDSRNKDNKLEWKNCAVFFTHNKEVISEDLDIDFNTGNINHLVLYKQNKSNT